MQRLQNLLLLLILCTVSQTYAQRDIPPKPEGNTNQKAVYDYADVLSVAEESQLETKLIKYSDTTSTQIVIATIESLQGEYIGTYSAKWAQEWGIGQESEDNGLFILLARDDRKIWITTGYGLEEYMTDFTTKEIVDKIIIPEFKAGSYYRGLDKGTTAIFQVLDGTFKGTRQPNKSKEGFPAGAIIFIIFVIIFISLASKRNGRGGGSGSNRSGASLLDVIILSSLGRGGFGGGSSGGGFSGGGGFGGGFGGGGFGGGGAGGGW